MKSNIFFLLLGLFCSVNSEGQFPEIIGPNVTTPGNNTVFSNSEGECGSHCNYYWKADGGLIIESTETQVTVRWNDPGLYILELWEDHPYGEDPMAYKEILVEEGSYIEYIYDDAGNRISRQVIILPSDEKKSMKVDSDLKEQLAQLSPSFKVYPNPADQSVFVSLHEAALKASKHSIVIYDLMGKVVLRHEAKSSIPQIDLSSIGTGIYILRLEYDGKYKECKIIKQ